MGLCPASLGPGLCSLPLPRTVLSVDTFGMGCLPSHICTQGHTRCCCGCLPCSPIPPRHVVSSLVVSQSPRLQERLAAALSLSRRSRRRQHLPASGCCPRPPCSSEQPFPCHSGSHGREISIQTEGGRASGQPPPVFSGAEKWSLWGRQVSRPEPSPPPGGWDRVLGTQKRQQPALVPSHWVLGLTRWPPPSSATLCCPLVCFRVAQCLVVVYVERQARRGRGKEGRDSSC